MRPLPVPVVPPVIQVNCQLTWAAQLLHNDYGEFGPVFTPASVRWRRGKFIIPWPCSKTVQMMFLLFQRTVGGDRDLLTHTEQSRIACASKGVRYVRGR